MKHHNRCKSLLYTLIHNIICPIVHVDNENIALNKSHPAQNIPATISNNYRVLLNK